MVELQIWLVNAFAALTAVARLMHTVWVWPIAESLHFIGLSLLIGTVGLFDLRLLGVGRHIPLAAMHRLIRWGLVGFGLNAITGSLFLIAEPDQYIYNISFQAKMLFVLLAGCNALAFYATSYRRAIAGGPTVDTPRAAKIIAAVSLTLWICVIIAGRLLTFYRPFPCEGPAPRFLASCLP
jgi:uncharacterized membrane protein